MTKHANKPYGTGRPGGGAKNSPMTSQPRVSLRPKRVGPTRALTAPSSLGAVGKAQWRKITKALARANVLTGCDVGTLSYYCMLFQQQHDVAVQIKAEGTSEKLRAEQRRIGTELMKCAGQLALTPYGRHRIALQAGAMEFDHDDEPHVTAPADNARPSPGPARVQSPQERFGADLDALLEKMSNEP